MIAHELTKAIKENMSIDWNLRDSARAKMRIAARWLLKKYGYPTDFQNIISKEGLLLTSVEDRPFSCFKMNIYNPKQADDLFNGVVVSFYISFSDSDSDSDSEGLGKLI